jgi:hypothetical protein
LATAGVEPKLDFLGKSYKRGVFRRKRQRTQTVPSLFGLHSLAHHSSAVFPAFSRLSRHLVRHPVR